MNFSLVALLMSPFILLSVSNPFVSSSQNVILSDVIPPAYTPKISTEEFSITASQTKWIYKKINQHLYKRLWDISQNKYIGDWILVR